MPKMHQNAFSSRAPPGPAGEPMRSPRPSSCNRGLLLRGTEGRKGRREGTEREGEGIPAKARRINTGHVTRDPNTVTSTR